LVIINYPFILNRYRW